jgi:hypothetical protein
LAAEVDSTVKMDGANIGDLLPAIVLRSGAQSGEYSPPDVTIYFSDEVDFSSEVTGVGGVATPTRGDSFLLGAVEGSELPSAPSPCLSGLLVVANSWKGILGLDLKWARRMTVGWPNGWESRWETLSTSVELGVLACPLPMGKQPEFSLARGFCALHSPFPIPVSAVDTWQSARISAGLPIAGVAGGWTSIERAAMGDSLSGEPSLVKEIGLPLSATSDEGVWSPSGLEISPQDPNPALVLLPVRSS